VTSVLSNYALGVFLGAPSRDFLVRSITHLGILNDPHGLSKDLVKDRQLRRRSRARENFRGRQYRFEIRNAKS